MNTSRTRGGTCRREYMSAESTIAVITTRKHNTTLANAYVIIVSGFAVSWCKQGL